MRALLQRVSRAEVRVGGAEVGSCGAGLLILLGVAESDTPAEAELLWNKIRDLRIFQDEADKTNLSLTDIGGEVCVVSQFTLYASTRKGRRPSFTDAASPEKAEALYEHFCELAEADVEHVGRGVFGAMMEVSLVNDGPFTIWLDTEDLHKPRRG